MKAQRGWFLVALVLAWQCLMPLNAQADMFQWNVSGNGNWNVDGNWDNPGYPNASADGAKIGTLGGKDGTVTITGTSITLGALTLNSNVDGVQIGDGYSLLLPGATVNNNGAIKVGTGTGSLKTYLNNTLLTQSTLTGTGKVTLGGNLNDQIISTGGGGFLNDTNHTIDGGGTLSANITNKGNIIADNGVMLVTGSINNSGGVMSAAGGGVFDLRGSITGGNVNLVSGSFLLNGANVNANLGSGSFTVLTNGNTLSGTSALTLMINDGITLKTQGLVNNGTVTVGTGAPMLTAYNSSGALLTGTGKVTLGGDLNDQLISTNGKGFSNGSSHTIDGGGTIAANIYNYGNIVANHNTLRITGVISGSGSISVANNATLDIQNTVSTSNFSMDQNATLLVSNNKTINISQSFSFKQTDPSKWTWGDNSTLQLNHGSLEVGGEDLGYTPEGFSNNFNLVNLSIGAGSRVMLQDLIDNGHRGGSGGSAEALYLESLFVGEGAILYLNTPNSNPLQLYVDGFGLVTPTDVWFNGGGRIAIPLPSTLLMFGPGLLGLIGWRRLRKS